MQASTFFAFATPPGRSAIAALRISGPEALSALHSLGFKGELPPRRATRLTLTSGNGEAIDDALFLYFPKPHSYTGEDVVELHVHGGVAIRRKLISELSGISGLAPAEAGDFTRQAFLNGKLDLVEAEGIRDLIDADTEQQRRLALSMASGEQSSQYEKLRQDMLEMMSLIEAYIDFPDEDIPPEIMQDFFRRVDEWSGQIQTIIKDGSRGQKVREGYRVALCGPPNVGKSSIINYLSNREIAIVSHIPGTTRDVIEVELEINGYPVFFMDTAGIRDAIDPIEMEGINRAIKQASASDLILWIAEPEMTHQIPKALYSLLSNTNILYVFNKCDTLVHTDRSEGLLFISAKTGEGFDALLSSIINRLEIFPSQQKSFAATERQLKLLEFASREIQMIKVGLQVEIMSEHLRAAANAVGDITGKILSDEVLGTIFSKFCIGK